MPDRIVIPPTPMRVRKVSTRDADGGWTYERWTLVVFIRVIGDREGVTEANAYTTDHRWLDLEGEGLDRLDIELAIDGEWQS